MSLSDRLRQLYNRYKDYIGVDALMYLAFILTLVILFTFFR